jgi:perosamine synthetase
VAFRRRGEFQISDFRFQIDSLAINGGPPALPEGPPPWPRPDEAVREALAACYADGSWGRYHGPHCQRLRELLTTMHGVAHAWLCSSGTIAVELALRALKIGPGDEVILAGYDFPGNFRAIEAIGARPVLVDLAADSWTIDAKQVAAAISPETKAVIVSHLHGSLADMPRLRAIADERGLSIVEDACQVPGAGLGGKPAGAWGDAGVLSFGGSKLLTAGRGGAIVTNRDDVLQRLRVYCERGNDAFPLSELQAAVLAPQIERLPADNQRRLAAVNRLRAACGDLPGLFNPEPEATDHSRAACASGCGLNETTSPAFYKLPWLMAGNVDACDSPEFEQLRRQFIAAARAEGLALDEGFRGFGRRSGNRCRVFGDLTRSRLAATGTLILHHPVLLSPDETIDRVARAMRKVAAVLLTGQD